MSLSAFWAQYEFPPDDFQLEAAEAIAEGMSVVVTAPTGAGKTLVAEAATYLGRTGGARVFYTTPIKALSNQKFNDLSAAYPDGEVGLLTGDNVVNPEAPVIVATLEVLRNMIYADPERLEDVSTVILDEAHYLQDRSRGAAWEEVIIHCPPHVRFVCLSATISNNEQFAEWIAERRGPTRLVTSDIRPVPLESMYMIKERSGARTLHFLPMFVEREGRRRPNPRLEHMLGLERGRRHRFKTPSRQEVIEELANSRMLPAIYFIFSRSGCDAAAMRLADAGIRLTDAEERRVIRAVAEESTAHLGDDDLAVLGYDRWMYALECGVAAHHAGLVPAFKETVEELFKRGLVKAVFATETLALGINMPARSVVIENLSKFNGESHELLAPGDYTQLTGRAGRRGIDVEGFGVVLHSPFVKFRQVTEIASVGSHELKSSFRPTYNMTANLVANYEEEHAQELLQSSFAAFQREERSAANTTQIEALEHQLAKEVAQSHCDRGDVEQYLAMVEAAPPTHRRDGIAALLRPGVVVDVDGGSRDGRYVVLKRLSSKNGGSRYLVLSTSGRVSTLGHRQIPDTSETVASIDLPQPFRPRDRRFVSDTLRSLRKVPPRAGGPSNRDISGVDHPVAECPDAAHHVAALRRARRLQARLEQQRSMRRTSGFGLLEEFRSIQELLTNLAYLEGWRLTPRGERLRKLYNESDLLVAEALERGALYDLDPSELAALVSIFVYEPRTDQMSTADWPSDRLEERWAQVDDIWKELNRLEGEYRLSPMRRPDPGFGRVAFQWANGAGFDELTARSMAPGDFVRVSRQLADLLRQLRDAAPEMSDEADAALRAVDRGVVAAQGVG
ncbi:MAG TPA: DEAD/DEAH box helicase [Acidimicrobiia bacterium]|nr:DEAD/DEAH box helicase [Acidimicrobiia bacterium]